MTSTYINNISKEYATYVMENRAIPMITDGLKLSQRIALYLLRNQAKSIKTAGLVGRLMESGLYVHGDASAADAISRLAAPFINNYPLITGDGAFGTRVAPVDGIGAARYTEVRRSKFSVDNLYIDMDICPQRENYDGSAMMPKTFLPLLPLVLLNGVRGIAIGFATNILPRSIEDVREGVIDVIKNGYTTRPLMPFYERYDCDVIQDHTNRNKFYLRGKVSKLNTTTVHISELPPAIGLDYIKGKLIALEDQKIISSFVDNSTNKIDIIIKMPRAILAKYSEERLLTLFKIVSPETENLTVLSPDGTTVVKYNNPQDLLKDFVEYRISMYQYRYKLLVSNNNEEIIFVKSFLSCFETVSNSRSVAASISGIKSKKDLYSRIVASIENQNIPIVNQNVDKIVSLPIYRFTKESQDAAKKRLRELIKQDKEYSAILKSESKQKKKYIDEIT